MGKAADLTGMGFGFLKVIERGADHITKSGQKKIRWLCECQLCKTKKLYNVQDLKRGLVVSCGCYRAYKGKMSRNKKTCIICGKDFECPPSDKTVTCSAACRSEYARKRTTGNTLSDETKKKISEKARGRDLSELQPIATEAAKRSPNSGRFKTNVNAKDWHLISPEGKHYYFHSLSFWMRENCRELFGFEPDTRDFLNALSGLNGAKRVMLGKKHGTCTYKGWRVIPTSDDDPKHSS